MTKHIYVGDGSFIQGLPAQDLDDELFDDDQKALLAGAVEAGLYQRIEEKPAAAPAIEQAAPAPDTALGRRRGAFSQGVTTTNDKPGTETVSPQGEGTTQTNEDQTKGN